MSASRGDMAQVAGSAWITVVGCRARERADDLVDELAEQGCCGGWNGHGAHRVDGQEMIPTSCAKPRLPGMTGLVISISPGRANPRPAWDCHWARGRAGTAGRSSSLATLYWLSRATAAAGYVASSSATCSSAPADRRPASQVVARLRRVWPYEELQGSLLLWLEAPDRTVLV
jgi:hypothetical protein